MNGVIGEFRIGEDIAVILEVADGETAIVSAVSARMMPAKAGANRLMLDDSASAIVLQVTPDGPAGWTLSLSSAASAALAPGIYGIDAKLSFAGGVEITEQTAFVSLTKASLL